MRVNHLHLMVPRRSRSRRASSRNTSSCARRAAMPASPCCSTTAGFVLTLMKLGSKSSRYLSGEFSRGLLPRQRSEGRRHPRPHGRRRPRCGRAEARACVFVLCRARRAASWSRSALDSRRRPVLRLAARHARRARRQHRHGRGLRRLPSAAARRRISSRCAHTKTRRSSTSARTTCVPCRAPRNGSMLMGFDEQGHCFMFANGGCSIYPHRPETCRTYDCRVFTAAGMNAGPDKSEINERIASWRFEYPEPRAITKSIGPSRPRRISSAST